MFFFGKILALIYRTYCFLLSCINYCRGTEWNAVFKSESIKNTLEPNWKTKSIPLSLLCAGDYDCPLKLSIYDYESKGDHVLMGEIETTVNILLEKANSQHVIQLMRGDSPAGTLQINAQLDDEGIRVY